LGFVVGPLSFDQPILDDSMFWGRLDHLNTPENLEWLDWKRTPNAGRRLDWSAIPRMIMPQLCVNSPAVKAAVTQRVTLIGGDITQGLRKLQVKERQFDKASALADQLLKLLE
jgi:hypothetical protein